MTRFCIGLLIVAYPFMVLFLSTEFPPTTFILVLGALGCLRLGLQDSFTVLQRGLACAGMVAFCLIAFFDEGLRTLKLYPVLVNLGLAALFTASVIHPPSAIERISIRFGMQLSEAAIVYTRRLTVVWVGFFITNGLIASYTALYTSTEIWALYNGFISYLCIALLLGLEYPVRVMYRKRHGEL